MRRSSAAAAALRVTVTAAPEMATDAAVPAMLRLDPDFVAVTVNALPAGVDVASSAVSKVTTSSSPSTVARVTRVGSTVTVTVSVTLIVPSLNVSEKVRSVRLLTGGATNTGVGEVVSSSATVGPAVCVQA